MLTTLLSHVFSFFFLIIHLYILITAVIPQIFVSTAALEIPAGIPNKEEKAEIETYSVIVNVKIQKYSM